MIISHIVAIAKNNAIGKNNDIPWKIPGEQTRFKELTMNRTILMGRKTYESIGSKLVGRRIIILSRTMKDDSEEYRVVTSVKQALKLVNTDELFIVGGGKLYKETIEMADKLYVTELDREVDGDIYYPNFDRMKYNITFERVVEEANIPYTYFTYEKI